MDTVELSDYVLFFFPIGNFWTRRNFYNLHCTYIICRYILDDMNFNYSTCLNSHLLENIPDLSVAFKLHSLRRNHGHRRRGTSDLQRLYPF